MNKLIKILTITIVCTGLITQKAQPMRNILGSDTHTFGEMMSRQSGLNTVPDEVGKGGLVGRMMIWAATKAGAGFIAKHGVSAVTTAASKLWSAAGGAAGRILGITSTPEKTIRVVRHRRIRPQMKYNGEVREITSREPSKVRRVLRKVDNCVSKAASGIVSTAKGISISDATGTTLVKGGLYSGTAYAGYRGLRFVKNKVVEMASTAWGITKLAIGVAAVIGIGVIVGKVGL